LSPEPLLTLYNKDLLSLQERDIVAVDYSLVTEQFMVSQTFSRYLA